MIIPVISDSFVPCNDAIAFQYFVRFSTADKSCGGTSPNFSELSNHSCVTESKAFWQSSYAVYMFLFRVSASFRMFLLISNCSVFPHIHIFTLSAQLLWCYLSAMMFKKIIQAACEEFIRWGLNKQLVNSFLQRDYFHFPVTKSFSRVLNCLVNLSIRKMCSGINSRICSM